MMPRRIRRCPISSSWGVSRKSASESPKPVISSCFDFRGAVDIVDSRVRSFEHEVASSGVLLLSVDQDSAFQSRRTSSVKHSHLKPLVGDEGSMRCQSLLTVSTALHGLEYIREVPPYTPSLRAGGLG